MTRWPWRKLRPQAPAPAPSPGQAPGHDPAAGQRGVHRVATGQRPAPPPARDGIYGRRVMTVLFFDTGITVTIDHQRMRRIVDIPPVGEWHGYRQFMEDTAP